MAMVNNSISGPLVPLNATEKLLVRRLFLLAYGFLTIRVRLGALQGFPEAAKPSP
jgi:hypothetical protein